MSLHKGWTVTWDRGAWLARPWDPLLQRYGVSKRFAPPADKGDATAWAKSQAAILALQAQEAGPRGAGWPTTAALVKLYHEHLTRRGRSEVHLHDVRVVLDRFATAVPDLSKRGVLEDAERWLAELTRAPRGTPPKPKPGAPAPATGKGAAISAATRNRYLVTIKSMARWAARRGEIPKNPLLPMERFSQPRTLKAQFKIAELQRLASATLEPFYPRFALMLWAGLRAGEAHNLRWDDIDHGGRMISIRLGDYDLKGDKERLVPLQRELAVILDLLPRRSDGFLFEERLRTAYGSQHGRDLRRFCTAVGITVGDRTPHSLRHCYAGLMTATAVPSVLLAAYMGHETTETTAGYASLATSYSAAVTGWSRGEFDLLPGATSAWRSAWPRPSAGKVVRKPR
jgi:integrase